jgi:hypothetical protein
MNTITQLLQQLLLRANAHQKDFLLTWEQTRPEIGKCSTGEMLKRMRGKFATRVFQRPGCLVFRDNSTERAPACLESSGAGTARPRRGQVTDRPRRDGAANMISFCAGSPRIRDDMFLGAGNAYMRGWAPHWTMVSRKASPQRPALVICNATLITRPNRWPIWPAAEHFGSLSLNGKKIAMTWAYSPSYGKPLSVPRGSSDDTLRHGRDLGAPRGRPDTGRG